MTAATVEPSRRRRRTRIGSWGTEALEESFFRDVKRRATQPDRPCTSTSPRRCVTCREWGFGTAEGFCRWCGDLFVPAPLVGQARVLDADLRRQS